MGDFELPGGREVMKLTDGVCAKALGQGVALAPGRMMGRSGSVC